MNEVTDPSSASNAITTSLVIVDNDETKEFMSQLPPFVPMALLSYLGKVEFYFIIILIMILCQQFPALLSRRFVVSADEFSGSPPWCFEHVIQL